MRIRVIKPDFWRDQVLARASDGMCLFYIGLWCEADDAGWLVWSVPEIGADLYPYMGVRSRERKIARHAEELMSLPGDPRLVVHPCGHAQVPNLPEHQRTAGGKVLYTVYKQHQRCHAPGDPRTGVEQVRTSVEQVTEEGKVREGKVKKGKNLQLIDGEWRPAGVGS